MGVVGGVRVAVVFVFDQAGGAAGIKVGVARRADHEGECFFVLVDVVVHHGDGDRWCHRLPCRDGDGDAVGQEVGDLGLAAQGDDLAVAVGVADAGEVFWLDAAVGGIEFDQDAAVHFAEVALADGVDQCVVGRGIARDAAFNRDRIGGDDADFGFVAVVVFNHSGGDVLHDNGIGGTFYFAIEGFTLFVYVVVHRYDGYFWHFVFISSCRNGDGDTG